MEYSKKNSSFVNEDTCYGEISMSDLTSLEKLSLERCLQMGSGHVLNFTNRTFQEFVLDNTSIDIDDSSKYGTASKANRLRKFWAKEPNHVVGQLITAFVQYWESEQKYFRKEPSQAERDLLEECTRISGRLKQGISIEDIDVIQANADDKNFDRLAKAVREYIDRNEPELGLDRLHTFAVKYFRGLCTRHELPCEKDEPLHSAFGKYVRHLTSKSIIQSAMAERILKSSISVLEAYNDVRNNQSLAHDNPVLNYDESLLIFNNVLSTIRFVGKIEQSILTKSQVATIDLNDINL